VSYRWVEHTAELELEIEGPNAEAVFADALLALTELLSDGDLASRRGAAVSVQVTLDGRDRAMLLAAWLDELVFRAETDGLVPGAIEQIELGEHHLTATIRGTQGAPRHLVKGITHHRLAFERAEAGFHATVVLDV
jgi:SHS2 domain-containing protein